MRNIGMSILINQSIIDMEATTNESTHYCFIWDKQEILKFGRIFLNGFHGDQCAVMMMAARKKYDPNLDGNNKSLNGFFL